jgi:hypothetical protein
MKRIGMWALAAVILVAPSARASVTMEYLFTGGYPNSVSADGHTIAGGTYASDGAFRWTQAGGFSALGMDPTPSPNGTPGVSADGSRVAGTIHSSDTTYAVAGLWTLGSGWTQLPWPADVKVVDRSTTTVYGLSGDGGTVVGLYYRTSGHAHAFQWTLGGGSVDLGSQSAVQASRANSVNYDGSVIVGWDEYWRGNWRPAVWLNGVETVLDDSLGDGQVTASSPDGTTIVGFDRNPATDTREVARWTRSGNAWSATQYLGSVPGTQAGGTGENYPHGITADGSMIVGYCTFDGSPYNSTGFVWTQSTGVIDVVDWLQANGVAPDPSFMIQNVTGISPDGQWIIGYGQQVISPYTRMAFRIHDTNVAGVPVTAITPRLALAAPSPNPSSGSTTLSFSLPADGAAELAIFDAAGRRVATPVRMAMAAGPHEIVWDGAGDDGRALSDGMYFARLTTARGSVSRRLVRIR